MQGEHTPTSGEPHDDDNHRILVAATISLLAHIALISAKWENTPLIANEGVNYSHATVVHAHLRFSSKGPADKSQPMQEPEKPTTPTGSRLPQKVTRPEILEESTPPIPRNNISLDDLQAGVTGEVLLLVRVDELGVARGVEILRSNVPKNVEGQIVLRFFQARYQPAKRGERPEEGTFMALISLEAETQQNP